MSVCVCVFLSVRTSLGVCLCLFLCVCFKFVCVCVCVCTTWLVLLCSPVMVPSSLSLSPTHKHTHAQTHTEEPGQKDCCQSVLKGIRARIQNEAHTKTRMRVRPPIVGRIDRGNVCMCVCASDSADARIVRWIH